MMDRWMLAYCPCDDSLVPGLDDDDVARLARPDPRVPQRRVRHVAHPRHVRGARPPACRAPSWSSRRGATTSGTSVEPRSSRSGSLFVRWPLLVPQLVDWADRTIGGDDDRTAREELTMTTMTVRPIRDDLSFGARVGGVTLDGLGDPDVRAPTQRGLRGARAADLRGRRADPEDAGGDQHRVRAAQGPPEHRRRPGPAATTCSASSRSATSRTRAGVVQARRSAAVAVAAVALRPLLQRPAQPGRCAPRRRGPARTGA